MNLFQDIEQQVLNKIRTMTIAEVQEFLGETKPQATRPAKVTPIPAHILKEVNGRVPSGARLAEATKAKDTVLALIATSGKEGMKMEELRESTKIDAEVLRLVLKSARENKEVKVTGEKRAMRYFAGNGKTAPASKRGEQLEISEPSAVLGEKPKGQHPHVIKRKGKDA